MKVLIALGIAAVMLAGCAASPAATPIVIYITPPPQTPIVIYVTPAPATPTPKPTPSPSPTPASYAEHWAVSAITRDPVTDAQTATASTYSTSGRSQFGDAIGLYIRCKNGDTDLYLDWNQFVNNEAQTVITRIGTQPATQRAWNNSTDYEATFFFGDPSDFIKSMFGQTQFIAQTTPYGSNTITATFNITGVQDAVANVRQACGW